MPLVTVRDARPGDDRAVAAVWAAAVPHLVRSPAQAAADLRAEGRSSRDRPPRRRRWVAEIGGRVVGTASADATDGGPTGADPADRHEIAVSVEVDPSWGSRGVGSALLERVVGSAPRGLVLRAVARTDPVALAFAVRGGFLPETELVAGTVPTRQTVARVVPAGLRPVTLAEVVDPVAALAHWWAEAAVDDPGRLVRPTLREELGRRARGAPDHAPELSWGLATAADGDLVALSTTRVDREAGRSSVEVTAVRPSYRQTGMGAWVLRRTLAALHEAGLEEAVLTHDPASVPATALARRVGLRPRWESAVVVRRLQR